MHTYTKWRRIYRTVRLMSMMDFTLPVDVAGWKLPYGRAEVRLDIVGIVNDGAKIKGYVDNISVHPGLRDD